MSALEYVSVVALVFPTVASMVEEEERPRVLAGLGITSKLAQVPVWMIRSPPGCCA